MSKEIVLCGSPIPFAVNLMTKIDPFSSFAVVLLIALLFRQSHFPVVHHIDRRQCI